MSYEINGVQYDYCSAKNQSIIDKLIDREVYCCMTSEMEYMLGRVFEADEDNPFDESDYIDSLGYRPVCTNCGECDNFEEIDFSDLADDDFKKSGDQYVCPVCGCEYGSLDEAKECCSFEDRLYRCSYCGEVFSEHDYDRLDSKPAEVFEWWAVSTWFGEKLKEQGCVVIDSWGKSYWGRETTGQAISLDWCVIQIAANMGILEGMEYEWKVA